MDLVHVRSFAQVAERGTVAAAAAALEFTPPAVSQHIAKLETELGVALFDRIGGRLRLTDAGTALLPVALELMDVERRGRAGAAHAPDRPHYRVAGFASAIASLLVPKVATLQHSMSIEIIECEDADALRDLRLGAVDLVLTQEYQGHAASRDARMIYTPVLTDDLKLVLPAAMPPTASLADLSNAAWLVNGRGTRCTAATVRVLEAAGLDPTIAASVADNTTLLALVAAGHGVTIVPETLLEHVDDAAITVATQDLGVKRTLYAVHRISSTDVLAPLLSHLL